MKIPSEKLRRRPKGKELLGERRVSVEVFDPREIPKEELDWMKDVAREERNIGLRGARKVATGWIDWIEPGYTAELVTDPFVQTYPEYCGGEIQKTDPVKRWSGIMGFAKIVGVVPDARSHRPEYPELERVFAAGNEFRRSLELEWVRSLLQVWPERQEQILAWAFDQGKLRHDVFLEDLTQHPLIGFIQGAADLVLIFPDSRPEVEEYLESRSEEVQQLVSRVQKRAHAPRGTAPLDPFIGYQDLLRALTILTAGDARIDEQGKIQLTSKKAKKLQVGLTLPERYQG